MKLKNIAKASLALGILTTGMITTTAQPVKAENTLEVRSQATQDLSEYYKGRGFELTNVTGYKDGNKVTFIDNSQQIDVTLAGNEKLTVKDDDEVSNVDVFVVREGSDKSAITTSIGGITKTNGTQHIDTVQNVNLLVSKSTGQHTTSVTSTNYSIYKEKISLKELDFKLRKHLIDKHDLYKTEPKDSKIRITMKDGGFYTFELNKKLQTHRMGDVIDGRNIEKIEVNL
ncbi:TPA: superantigen-like protein SSL11 [Staphylococcus aureus]|uniref:superantigen-like protein SSL11 n=1 Tax=Staphylococcus aureus TaxID=1280 RepID=UPI00215B9C3F|nr:superantigen-like protein SSL11 [Staphylococcus aureus]UVJ29096.1 superantigen-like protein SSL11 [Staphylococcus aureus]HDH4223368.1 superantigen-like protein SSL11 [Staphylococcus aureus]HDH4248053.1 superantigen-like protein SSL11 [Staphylococcus aureus]HDH4408494.1 superantigen-like protein SSL11 [Staphylococcus aureus]HDH4518294.1 superantigen-like protein SSL11 [Staphylococcus aureus]